MAKERPVWITERIWAQLQEEWSMQAYKKLCETNKKNRASDCGGQGFPKHVGGSITHMTHMDKLREIQGYKPTLLEGFMHTHSRMTPQGDRVWVDDRSRNLHSKYVETFETSTSEGGSNITPPMSTQIDRWREISGGSTKSRVYGLAGLAHSQPSRPSGSGSSQREKELENEVNGLKEHMMTQQSEMDAMRAQIAGMASMRTQLAEMDQMRAQLAEMDQMRARMASMDQMQATLAFLMSQHSHTPSALPFPTPSTTIPFPAPSHGPSARHGKGIEQEISSSDDE